MPVLVALRQWGARWTSCQPANARLVDTRDGLPVQEVGVLAADGRRLSLHDVKWVVLEQDEAPQAPSETGRVAAAG